MITKRFQHQELKKVEPIPLERTQITHTKKVFKVLTKSYEISLKSDKDPLVQLQGKRLAIGKFFGDILKKTKGFNFVETMKVVFIKRKDDKSIHKPAYFNSRTQ